MALFETSRFGAPTGIQHKLHLILQLLRAGSDGSKAVGVATPSWLTYQDGSLGLWKLCQGRTCVTLEESDKPDWFKASEALAVLGLISGWAALLVAGVLVVRDFMDREPSRGLAVSTLLGSVVSFVMVIIGVIVFSAESYKLASEANFGYSFGLSTAGACLILIGGIGTAISSLRRN
ncbi:hypothetical protein RRG08_067134 [Elysia crispata]|uniref:Uncharacterized protein n=1 Tax=Elysia crispata TaxID=231223 RepID=A0AAE0ZHA9_9GAST|nr:hypothetical protein RRG08_067134 [Elysia crispata]